MEDNSSMENSSDSQDNNIILPESTDLDWAQITYALNYSRIIFITNYQTWLNFYTENSENGYKYNDYSPEELCYRFLHRVLPNINDYQLNDDELHLLNLLDLHPNFKRTESGFDVFNETPKLSSPSNVAATEMLMAHGGYLHGTNFVGESVSSNEQIVITGCKGQSAVRRKFNFNEENAALLSVILSSDEDLPNCELLTIEEAHKRLKHAKRRFEHKGQQLMNMNISVDDLLKKLKTINELKSAVTALVDKSMSK